MPNLEVEPDLPAWKAYKANPCRETFGPLLRESDEARQRLLLAHMQKLYFETEHWKVAQHLALILTGVHIRGWPEDQLLAEYFAMCARQKSSDDPLAAILAAWVHWHRRLPLAVLHDLEQVDKARAGSWPSEQFGAEYYTLLSMARAYMGQTTEAWQAIQQGESAFGTVLLSAFEQLLGVLGPEDDALEPVAMRVTDFKVELIEALNPHASKLVTDAVRRRLLRVLIGRSR